MIKKQALSEMITNFMLVIIFLLNHQNGWAEEYVVKYPAVAETDTRLFDMLIAGRFESCSRGIGEALSEYYLHKERFPDLRIEETILRYYPYPVTFSLIINTQDWLNVYSAAYNRCSKTVPLMNTF
jgi:hypothetical protein